MPSAIGEATFLADLVRRGVLNADGARELIEISPEEERALQSLAETVFDRRLVRAAIRFRHKILQHFDALLAPPVECGLTATEQVAISFLLKASEREAQREKRAPVSAFI